MGPVCCTLFHTPGLKRQQPCLRGLFQMPILIPFPRCLRSPLTASDSSASLELTGQQCSRREAVKSLFDPVTGLFFTSLILNWRPRKTNCSKKSLAQSWKIWSRVYPNPSSASAKATISLPCLSYWFSSGLHFKNLVAVALVAIGTCRPKYYRSNSPFSIQKFFKIRTLQFRA